MKISSDLYLVGSGSNGFDLTNPFDCNIYLFDAGPECILFDAGAGMGTDEMLAVCEQDGVDTKRINYLFLTHAHADHAGGAAQIRDRLGVEIVAPPRTAEILRAGDEDAVSLTPARAGGIYPQDYVYRAAPVETVLSDGDVMEIGKYRIEAIATPGHSHDHYSFLVSGPDRRYLIGGDAIFHGGKIILQNTYDCDVKQTIESIERLSTFEFEALLPGHLTFSFKNGKRHIAAALEVIKRFACPESIM